jgi:DNA-directed RNA polymerase specialized sigma subunit
MAINFGLERKKFMEAQKKLRKEYEDAGMTKEQILAMYEYDLKQFNRDIAFYRHTQPLATNMEEDDEGGRNPLLTKFSESLSVMQKPTESDKFWWLDEIEDMALLKRLIRLSAEDLELLDLLAFQEHTQLEISIELKKSQSSVSQRVSTIRKKINNPQNSK